MLSVAAKTIAVCGGFFGSIYGFSWAIGKERQLKHLVDGIARGARCIKIGTKIARKYLREGINEETHDFAAKKLSYCLKTNGGCFLKLAELICKYQHLLPISYIIELEPLCHECPKTDFQEIKKILDKEYSRHSYHPTHFAFSSIEPEPISCSPISQVHKAYLMNGTAVTIKVQHSNIWFHRRIDAFSTKWACAIAELLFRDFKLGWIAKEFKSDLLHETDFRKVAQNSDFIRELHKDNEKALIPKVYEKLSTSRVQVMKFEEGGSITDTKYIRENNISMKEIATALNEILNKQIFKFGYVNFNIHQNNVLTRIEYDKRGNRNLKIILLNHSIYKEIDDDLKYHYLNLWRGIINNDKQILQRVCNNLGIENPDLFLSIIVAQNYNNLIAKIKKISYDKRFALEMTIEEKIKLKKYSEMYHTEVNKSLSGVKREVLQLLKISEFLRNIDIRFSNPYNATESLADHIYKELFSLKDVKISNYEKLRLFREYLFLKISLRILMCFKVVSDLILFWWPDHFMRQAEDVFKLKY